MTDRLFCERAPLSTDRRTVPNLIKRVSSVYNFFDLEYDSRPETDILLTHGIPLNIASKISKINNHNKDLCMLGILPNQLRDLLKLHNPANYDVAFEDFSRELFWHGYKIWLARTERSNYFWNNIAPEWWKPHHKEVKNSKSRIDIKSVVQVLSIFLKEQKTWLVKGQPFALVRKYRVQSRCINSEI
jgi:hypothetical protein